MLFYFILFCLFCFSSILLYFISLSSYLSNIYHFILFHFISFCFIYVILFYLDYSPYFILFYSMLS